MTTTPPIREVHEQHAKRPPPFKTLAQNKFLHRKRAKIDPDSVPVCECVAVRQVNGIPASDDVPNVNGAVESKDASSDLKVADSSSIQSSSRFPRKASSLNCGPGCLNSAVRVECTGTLCPCGDCCRNQRMQKGQVAQTRLKHMGLKGWGLLADSAIPAEALVAQYTGEVLDHQEAVRRATAYDAARLRHTYIMSLGGDEVIDATRQGSNARFINHCCSPNCEMQKWQVLGELCVGIFAKRDITKGEEITYSYNLEWNGGRMVECCCGAAACVGYLGAHSRKFQQALAIDTTQLHSDVESVLDALPHFSGDSDSEDSPGGFGPPQGRPQQTAALTHLKQESKPHTTSTWQEQHQARRQRLLKQTSAHIKRKNFSKTAVHPPPADARSSPTQVAGAAGPRTACREAARTLSGPRNGKAKTLARQQRLMRSSGARLPYSRKSKHRTPAKPSAIDALPNFDDEGTFSLQQSKSTKTILHPPSSL